MKEVTLFFGRFQPFHLGHYQTITEYQKENPDHEIVIGIIKAGKDNYEKNPLAFEYQEHLISLCFQDMKIFKFTSGYIGHMIQDLEGYGLKPSGIICGSDRVEKYEKWQLGYLKSHGGESLKLTPASRLTSGTEVRESIMTGDYHTFTTLMPDQLLGEFEELQRRIGIIGITRSEKMGEVF